MVLVHKLKQMEELDLKQFREGEDDAEGEETTPIEAPEEPEAETAPAVQPEVEAEAEAEDEEGAQSDSPSASKKKGASPPRRPITRSQTTPGGLRPSFRKVHQTNESDTEQPSASPRGRGRPRGSANKGKGREVSKPTSNGPPAAGRKRPITEVESEDEGENRGPSRRRESSETDISFSLNISRANTEPPPEPAPGPSQEDTSISDASRAIRSRATLPVPVPNLTKKSRGRRVPTKTNVTEPDPSQKDAPFKCTHPACDKYFNRHDNLLQHLKVHKDPALLPMARQNARADASGSVAQPLLQVPPGFLASIPTGLFPQTGDPAVDFSTNLAIALLSTLRNSVAMVPALAAADPSSPFRNMGMESSLRTEMP
ncbi:hypothetical protein ONZ45_g12240 [Pleurotus djamor]|nr:hypothetical protein ONZ45_g12240 [Pleurotus djamor]